tara:strand:+ start:539 stop:1210 length:672 start_codon:yes stop_codon:yes gene_type:complete
MVMVQFSKKHKILILVSGRGSNMVSIIKTCRRFEWPVDFLSVISDRPCEGILKARDLGIKGELLDRAKLGKDAFQSELFKKIKTYVPDIIVLAGFMVILDAKLFSGLFHLMINVHPSLLPEFKGLNTHQRVLDENVRKHGATVHSLSSGVDEGPIICQAAISVATFDTKETLEKKVLALEHFIFPLSIGAVLSGKVIREGDKWNHVENCEHWFLEEFKLFYDF